MKYEANTPDEYINQLPEDRKEVILKIREVISQNIPEGFEAGLGYGMLSWHVPFSTYPSGYHCDNSVPLPFMNLASQKNFVALYHSGIYANQKIHDWFVNEYPKHCKYKLDMGKSCVRFKKMNDIPYDLIAELVTKITPEAWIATYEKNIKR
ncbi:DUF1801 domain-containing protein [Urechidicola vernalis]|uniref:DUF1801 domain-containing protein n=1 Tax=Urechidicola vernalis TaxID=3075600 RepID=A0ABU2Y8Q1_9FLAO|nr:DUF1801 domain-containing protein [Urechidicola sp. P050]MDT0554205.1 DUF1801 domain-containing protein [Urechidicola sp. P050]